MRAEDCPTCSAEGRRGYCAPRRCYCRHDACPATVEDGYAAPLLPSLTGRIAAGNTRGQRAKDDQRRALNDLANRTAIRVGPGARSTSQAMVEALPLPRQRTMRLEVFALVAAWTPTHDGLTDDELERALGRSHQSVSATRNALMNDGYLEDSGKRRRTRYRNEAIVWTVAAAARPVAGTAARRAALVPGDGRLEVG